LKKNKITYKNKDWIKKQKRTAEIAIKVSKSELAEKTVKKSLF